MTTSTQIKINFPMWAAQTYAAKKEAVDILANSSDVFEQAIGYIIKKHAGVGSFDHD